VSVAQAAAVAVLLVAAVGPLAVAAEEGGHYDEKTFSYDRVLSADLQFIRSGQAHTRGGGLSGDRSQFDLGIRRESELYSGRDFSRNWHVCERAK